MREIRPSPSRRGLAEYLHGLVDAVGGVRKNQQRSGLVSETGPREAGAGGRCPADTPALERSWAMRRAFFEWDVVNWSKALEVWRRALPARLDGMTAVELGARGGGLALWLALRGAEVVCGYYGAGPEPARDLHRRYGVADRIDYKRLDATALPYEAAFDIVVMKSVLGGIGAHDRKDRQYLAVEQIHRMLRPGGVFLFAENVKATVVHETIRHLKRTDTWRYPTVDEMIDTLGIFRQATWQTHGFLGMFGRREWQRDMLGTMDDKLCQLLPVRSRYIMFGVAEK